MTVTTTPKRTQRQRGRQAPANERFVGSPSSWSNPFRLGEPYRFVNQYGELIMGVVGSKDYATELFKQYLTVRTDLYERIRKELGGVDLSCWCPLPEDGEEDRCHAAVLLRVARGEQP